MIYGGYPKPDGYYYASLTPTAETMWLQAEIMQFTGLTDKNGKEIWEGDIVMQQAILYNIPKNTRPNKVVWHNGGFCLEDGNLVKDCLGDVITEIEVIGNVWENPNLLEK